MSTSQVLDRTFYLYRNNFVLFAGIAMVAPALTLIASVVEIWILGAPSAPKIDPGARPEVLSQFFTDFMGRLAIQSGVGLVVYAVGAALATGATMYAVSQVHLGKTTTIAESYAHIKPVFWKLLRLILAIIVTALLPLILLEALAVILIVVRPNMPFEAILALALLIFFGMFGSLFWLVFAFCRYALAVPACTLEKLTVGEALRRSRQLIQGSMWRMVAVYLLTALMGGVLTSVLQMPAYIWGDVFTLKPGMHMSTFTLVCLFVGEFLGKTFAGPIVTIAIALVYYDQRVRKEAFDLQLMMEAMGGEPPQAISIAVPPPIG